MLMFQPLVKYADFSGRARRTEFWLWVLLQKMLTYAALAVMGFIVPSPFYQAVDTANPQAYIQKIAIYYAPILVIGVLLLIPSMAVQVRRLHDSNRTGWWVMLPLAAFAAGAIAATSWVASQMYGKSAPQEMMGEVLLAMYASCVPPILAGLLLFIFNLLDGTAGRNRFGPDPKGRGHSEPL